MTHNKVAIFLPAALMLVAVLACNVPPKYVPPLEHDDFPPKSRVADPDAMIRIPAGEFFMGCDKANDPYCDAIELPLHKVYLDSYAIDKYEVTNARYQACVEAGVCTPPFDANVEGREPYYGNPDYADFPVVWVTWLQAETFCAWDGKQLPTEAEWEKAARGSEDTRRYAFGSVVLEACTYERVSAYHADDQTYCVNGAGPVGSYPLAASPYGVMDMPGNVQEWVNDWYAEGYYAASPARNPGGPDAGELRGVRGGDYFGWPMVPHQIANQLRWEHESSLRVTWRSAHPPTSADERTGIRCAGAEDEP